jgi:IrrE N-terminal-like domain
VTVLIAAQEVLKELGVTEPSEIDIDAIAWSLGARVKYRPLDSCEARVAGNGDQAIITVNSRSSRRRKRFSVAHELGHWKYDRGRILVCRSDEIGRAGQNYPTAERVADSYAAQLLMPAYIFDPIARSYPKATFQTVTKIADLFDTHYRDDDQTRGRPALSGSAGLPWFPRAQMVHPFARCPGPLVSTGYA